MNNMHEPESEKKPLILAGIRDNLLKPMAEEICAKNENQIRSLRKLLWLGIGIAVISVLVQIAVGIMLVKCR